MTASARRLWRSSSPGAISTRYLGTLGGDLSEWPAPGGATRADSMCGATVPMAIRVESTAFSEQVGKDPEASLVEGDQEDANRRTV